MLHGFQVRTRKQGEARAPWRDWETLGRPWREPPLPPEAGVAGVGSEAEMTGPAGEACPVEFCFVF